MYQLQCPNCGGYKTSQFKIGDIEPQKGRWVESRGCLGPLFDLVILSLPWPFLLIVVLAFDLPLGTYLLITVAILALWGGLVVWRLAKEVRKPSGVGLVAVFRHDCEICGYSWERREDQPPPRARARPDLIAKGHQRLEEEKDDLLD